jgi:hypothetical protein
MGHTRLGLLPRTRRWQEVIGFVAGGAGAEQVINATLHAAENGVAGAANDRGLVESFWSLTQVVNAAKEADFAGAMKARGFDVSPSPTLPAVVAAVSESVDQSMNGPGARTDLGELAHNAAAETLSTIVAETAGGLFGPTPAAVKQALAAYSTPAQFGSLGRLFFGRLMDKVVQYYVSKTSALNVGPGQRFVTLSAKREFDQAVALHCREAALIVQKFAGEWKDKTEWKSRGEAITREQVRGFTHVAMNKLVAELKKGAE